MEKKTEKLIDILLDKIHQLEVENLILNCKIERLEEEAKVAKDG